jgi:tetratricopeptide (TPR) repeat protein
MLGGLEIQDTAQYGAFIAGRPLPENLVETIYERTNGNPFFLREVVQLLADEGYEGDPSDLSRWGPTVPLGVREAVTLRLSRLSDDARRVLVDAAIIGSEFGLELLATVSNMSIDDLLDLLEEAIALGVIVEDSTLPNRFRFTHILVRQALYESLILARRARVHARIGEALEKISASSSDPPYAELAHHFFLSAATGEAERAVKYLTAAGEQSMARLAYVEAVDQFRHALEIVERFMPERQDAQFDVLLLLARAELAAGESDGARASRLRSVELARRLGDPERLAMAALQMVDIASDYLDWRAHDEAVLLEEVLMALPQGDGRLRIQLMSRLAHVLLFDKTTPESRERTVQRERLVQEAVSMAKRIGTPELIADALRAAHDVLWTYEDVDERIDIARELLALSIETANPQLELAARAQLTGEFLIKGLVNEADQELDAYETIATEYQLPLNIWSVTAKRAMRAFMRGELSESEALMEQARAIGRRSAPGVSQLSYLLQLFVMRREQDRLIEVEAMLTAEAVNHPSEALWNCLLAVLYVDTDRHDEASRIVAEVIDQPDNAIPRDSFWLASLVLIANACVELRDTGHAAVLLALLRPYANRFVCPGNHVIFLGPVSYYLGCLATCLEQWDAAAAYFDQALAAERAAATPVFEGRTALAYARMLARRGNSDDRATQFINAALHLSNRYGLARLGSLARTRREILPTCHSP